MSASTAKILSALIRHCGGVSVYVYFGASSRQRRDEAKFCSLLYADSHYLSDVCVLYRNVNWHGVLPLPYFCFIFSLRREAYCCAHAGYEHRVDSLQLAFWSVAVI